jgi:hypothetical protein
VEKESWEEDWITNNIEPTKSKIFFTEYLKLTLIIHLENEQPIDQSYKGDFPCNENRGKIDDFIAILGPINCALLSR